MTKILFTGGGSAGHIFPIIAVAREISKLGIEAEFFFLGPKDEFSSILFSQEGIKVKTIIAGKLRRYWQLKSILQNIIDLVFKIPLGFLFSFFYLFFLTPDLIFSKGGYGSLPVVFWGWIFGIPILLHESDVAPGLVNRMISKVTPHIFVSFPTVKTEYFSERKMIFFGNPIRKEILTGSKLKAQELFGLSGEKPVILVMGGSQGAQTINDLILAVLPEMLDTFELIHQTGEKNFTQVASEAKVMISQELEKYYHPIPFLKEIELKEAYASSDIIINRAGSGSIFEIAALAKPSILIPLPFSAQDHQVKNAYAYAESGAAVVIEEANLTPHFLLEKLRYLISHQEELEKMIQRAKEFSKLEAAHNIAQYIIDSLAK